MFGFISFAIGTWWMTYVTKDWDFWELWWPQIFRGVGLMFAIIPINNIALLRVEASILSARISLPGLAFGHDLVSVQGIAAAIVAPASLAMLSLTSGEATKSLAFF